MSCGFLVAWAGIVRPHTVTRKDGTKLAHFADTSLVCELREMRALLRDWKLLALLLPCFASEIAVIVLSTLNGKYTMVGIEDPAK